MNSFHLAIAVDDLEAARKFYTETFSCKVGRTAEKWIDFNFFGHQLSVHFRPEEVAQARTNDVDGKNIPVKHFGIILKWNEWHVLADKLRSEEMSFVVSPYIRFKGEVGEQGTFFLKDPSGNFLEFKTFKDINNLFKVDSEDIENHIYEYTI